MPHELLQIGPHVTALPVVHGSGDFAWEVRRMMLAHQFDCVAVPLPESFQQQVEASILNLPRPGIVAQREIVTPGQNWSSWSQNAENSGDSDADPEARFDSDDSERASYVPIDPCQPVIAAIRTAMGERIPRRFIDLETNRFEPQQQTLPDAYALKRLPIERYAAAVLPFLSADTTEQWRQRVDYMAWQLRELSVDFKKILVVLSVLDWPWIRQAFHDRDLKLPDHETVKEPESFSVEHDSLYFMMGELPLITSLYEKARQELDDDEHLAIDGVKELLIAAREAYVEEHGKRARKITPKLLAQCLKYTRNLTLINHRFTPQLATIVTAAQQCIGDTYALHVLETAKRYPAFKLPDDDLSVRMSLEEACFPDDEYLPIVSRLPGPPITWTNLELIPRPAEAQREDWQQKWNPYSQCSWPPEDELIENFRQSVFERAREVMGADLAKTEKFTTSVKDGIDIRETVRHWYEKQIYVKELPPARGKLDCAVMLFDSPADPRDYPWRTTWFAEHPNESTLAFFATDFAAQPVGPGICLGNYGGAMFIYPPVGVPDIWTDPRLDFASTLEERLLAAACLHSRCRHIALVSSAPPGIAWRQIARRFKKSWVHLPLGRFSDSTIQQLRMVHVLNGKEIRSYAANFIRRH